LPVNILEAAALMWRNELVFALQLQGETAVFSALCVWSV